MTTKLTVMEMKKGDRNGGQRDARQHEAWQRDFTFEADGGKTSSTAVHCD